MAVFDILHRKKLQFCLVAFITSISVYSFKQIHMTRKYANKLLNVVLNFKMVRRLVLRGCIYLLHYKHFIESA